LGFGYRSKSVGRLPLKQVEFFATDRRFAGGGFRGGGRRLGSPAHSKLVTVIDPNVGAGCGDEGENDDRYGHYGRLSPALQGVPNLLV
jgi:hypothetical protein